ncbi:MAG: sulfite exporter TauE/SafE family protein [Gemmataceae bacterium]|nr:sulfite exporter TauE/SafE family protein [Gemmataceae bacterium]
MDAERIALLVVTGVVSFVLSYVGAAAGLILGHLRLPLLVFTLGNPIAGASTNLAVSGAGALAGSLTHVRAGRVSWKVLLLMGIPSAVGAVVGVLFFVSVDAVWSHAVIGAMLVFSGWELVRAGRKEELEKKGGEGGKDDKDDKDTKDGKDAAPPDPPGRWTTAWEIVIGLVLGAVAAVTGLMLGTIRLPMMIRWLRIDPAVAVGSNMVIGCVTAVAAALTAWGAGGGLHPLSVMIVGPPTILGSYLGARQTGALSPAKLKRLVGWVVAGSGVFMVLLASPAFVSPPGPKARRMTTEDLPDLRPEAPRPHHTGMGFFDETDPDDPPDDPPEDR